MIRIASRNLNDKKFIRFALTPIKGIGKFNVLNVINDVYTEISKNEVLSKTIDSKEALLKFKLGELSEEVIVIIRNVIENNYLTEDDLRRKQQADIKRQIDLGIWKGLRHKLGLPTRGQRTKTNSRTVRGNRKATKSAVKPKTK